MKTFDNNGKLVSEINHFRTNDGKSVTTNTQYTSTGRVSSQNVTVCDSNTGKVTSTNTIGGKLLP
jgi:hypothetical protein